MSKEENSEPRKPRKKTRPNRQRLSRGSSFKRLATECRTIAANYHRLWKKSPYDDVESATLKLGAEGFLNLGQMFDAEAKRLRAMR